MFCFVKICLEKKGTNTKKTWWIGGTFLKIAFASVVLSTCREGTPKLTSVAFFPSRWVNFFLAHMEDKGAPELFSPMHNVVGWLGYARKSRESLTLDTSWNSVEWDSVWLRVIMDRGLLLSREICQFILLYRRLLIYCGKGFVGSFDVQWFMWARITDVDPDHPKATHP